MTIKSFDREDLHAPMADINTTPLVDVLLVLLVIFLVTAPIINQTIKLELPSENYGITSEENSASISIDANGNYYWDEKSSDLNEISKNLRNLATKNPNQPIYIRADGNAAYSNITHILSLISKEGLSDVRFVTKPKNNK